jgi:RNA polymerase sigma factor FliA
MAGFSGEGYKSWGKVKEAPKELWEQYKATSDSGIRNRLIEHYLPIVHYNAERQTKKTPQCVEAGDLFSAGVFGLMGAIEAFDLSREVKFKTYCTPRIRGAILDHLRKCDWVPRLVRSRAQQVESARRELENQLGRNPYDIELAKHLGLSLEELDVLIRGGTETRVTSLTETWSDNDGGDGKAMQSLDMIPDQRVANPLDKIQSADFMARVHERLNTKERLLVMLYYFDDLTMREIGLIMNLSESRVCQLRAEIINKLKKDLVD